METVDTYISTFKPPQARIMWELKTLLWQTLPHCQEKINYKIPFYYYLKWLCYFHVPNKQPNTVVLGFCQGAQLSNSQGVLSGDGKLVRHIIFDPSHPVDMNLVAEVIHEAVLLQEFLYKKK
jgi:hypothetical protein